MRYLSVFCLVFAVVDGFAVTTKSSTVTIPTSTTIIPINTQKPVLEEKSVSHPDIATTTIMTPGSRKETNFKGTDLASSNEPLLKLKTLLGTNPPVSPSQELALRLNKVDKEPEEPQGDFRTARLRRQYYGYDYGYYNYYPSYSYSYSNYPTYSYTSYPTMAIPTYDYQTNTPTMTYVSQSASYSYTPYSSFGWW